MSWNFLSIVQAALPIIVSILGVAIHNAIKTPNDAQRAVSLSKIAEGIAAMVVIQNPGASWATLLKTVVDQLKIVPNDTTTSNTAILNRVAAAALIANGASPQE